MIDLNMGGISVDQGELRKLVPSLENRDSFVNRLFSLKKADSLKTLFWNLEHM
jgi:hypothetical protein